MIDVTHDSGAESNEPGPRSVDHGGDGVSPGPDAPRQEST